MVLLYIYVTLYDAKVKFVLYCLHTMDEGDKRKMRIQEIEAAMQAADFWVEPAKAQSLIKELHDLKTEAEGAGAWDKGSAILSMVAGAGGDDAEDFAHMLLEMYRK